jgi:hypothetical protein
MKNDSRISRKNPEKCKYVAIKPRTECGSRFENFDKLCFVSNYYYNIIIF